MSNECGGSPMVAQWVTRWGFSEYVPVECAGALCASGPLIVRESEPLTAPSAVQCRYGEIWLVPASPIGRSVDYGPGSRRILDQKWRRECATRVRS